METSRRQFPVPEFSHKVRSRLLAPPPSGWWAGELGSIRRRTAAAVASLPSPDMKPWE
ncbi:hypothetical protein QR685DRAFT_571860 [Neurospora intermedia]|uniref:Uncharacterized protein n=1 Tax=Neurospora intermedia TaxID=5142 RepID=A0ABR3DGC5_NEUIN